MALVIGKNDPVSVQKAWKDYDKDTKILVNGADNEQYQLGLERVRRRIRANDAQFEQGEIGIVEGEISEHDAQCTLLSRYVLCDWAGVVDADGNPVEYSPETGFQLLKNNVAFFLFVIQAATQASIKKTEEVKETVAKQ